MMSISYAARRGYPSATVRGRRPNLKRYFRLHRPGSKYRSPLEPIRGFEKVMSRASLGRHGHTFRARSKKTGVATLVAVHYRLQTILDGAPRTSPVICLNAAGKPMTRAALQTAFFRLVRGLGLSVTFHGLRHTLGSEIVELGGTNEEAAAVLGHLSTRTTAHYSRHASRDRLAARAIKRLETRDRRN